MEYVEFNRICFYMMRWLSTIGALYSKSQVVDKPFYWTGHDRTCKESLYSTHPYLTYSNEKSTSPVMKKQSMLGYREKINIHTNLYNVVAKSSVEKSFPLNAWVCISSRPPQINPQNTPQPFKTPILLESPIPHLHTSIQNMKYKIRTKG